MSKCTCAMQHDGPCPDTCSRTETTSVMQADNDSVAVRIVKRAISELTYDETRRIRHFADTRLELIRTLEMKEVELRDARRRLEQQ